MDIEYTESDFREHANNKSMWIGSNAVDTANVSFIDHNGKYVNQKIEISDKAYKIFDELITNAFDHRIKCGDAPLEHGGPVYKIDVTYKNDVLTVTNNGPGFRIKRMEKSGLWSVESVCTRPFSGSNNAQDPYRVVGGQNGLGLKLIILSAISAEVTTVSLGDGYYYKQLYTSKGNDLDISPPEVIPIANRPDGRKDSYTSISLRLDYPKMFSNWDTMIPDVQGMMRKNFAFSILARLNQLIMFSQEITYTTTKNDVVFLNALPPVECRYNGTLLKLSAEKWIKFTAPNVGDIYTIQFSDWKTIKFPWTIIVGVAKPEGRRRLQSLSMVNNVTMSKDGTHIAWFKTHLERLILQSISKTIREKIEASNVNIGKYLIYMDFKFVPIANFKGQTKDSVTIDKAVWKTEKEKYMLADEVVPGSQKQEGKSAKAPVSEKDKVYKIKPEYRDIIKQIATTIEALVLLDLKNKPKAEANRKRGYDNNLHTPAVRMGVEENAILVVSEGNTAESTMKKVIRRAGVEVSEKTGFFSLRGVIINAVKNSKTVSAGDEELIVYNQKFEKNAVVNKFISSINLDRNADYYCLPQGLKREPTPEELERAKKGDADFKTLNYRRILISTDQDQDGSQITGLIMTLFNHQWPFLFNRGFILKYISPLLRVINTKEETITRFYSDEQFKQFLADNYGGEPPKHLLVYRYKGLGTHSEEDIEMDMTPKINQDSFRMIMDRAAKQIIVDIYGKSANNRKILLKSDVTAEFNPELYKRQLVLGSQYIIKDVCDFHRYNVARKLKCYLDGLNITQRKIVAACRRDRKGTRKINTVSLVGIITAKMGYPHGDASGIQTVAYSAQCFAGANNCPILYSFSAGVGSIEKGRDDIGQARYLNVGYNNDLCDLLFPLDDDPLLQWNVDEKQTLEPHCYISIIPYSILESATTPSSGWKINFWGRQIEPVFKNLIRMIQADTVTNADFINGSAALESYPIIDMEDLVGRIWMPTYQPKNKPTQFWEKNKNGKITERSVGRYKQHGDTIRVTSIPYRYWLGNLESSIKATGADKKPKHILAKNERVVQVVNHSTSENNLHLSIELTEGSVEWINTTEEIKPHSSPQIDRIVRTLDLYNEITLELNFTDENGNITCFDTFTEIERKWYVNRRNLYLERIARGTEIMQAKLTMMLNRLRYIRSSDAKVFYPKYYRNLTDSNQQGISKAREYLGILELSGADVRVKYAAVDFTIGNKTSKAERHSILSAQEFSRIDKQLLENVGLIKWNNIYNAIVDSNGAKYSYIDEIRVTDFDTDSVADLIQKIKDMLDKIENLSTNNWKDIWLGELDKIKTVIKTGLANRWKKEDLSRYKYV